MKKAIFYAFLSILTLSTPLLSGCSKKVDASQRLRPDGTPLTEYQVFENEIKDGIFYVRHSDSICEPVYLGEATFDQGSVSKTKNDKRVLVNGKYFSIKKGILFSRNAANYFP